MGVLDFIYGSSSSKSQDMVSQPAQESEAVNSLFIEGAHTPLGALSSQFSSSAGELDSTRPVDETEATEFTDESPMPVIGTDGIDAEIKSLPARGFSFRSLAFLSNRSEVKPSLSTVREPESKQIGLSKGHPKPSRSEKRAMKSALVVRLLIVGSLPAPIASKGSAGKSTSKPDLNKVKSQLMQPKSANRLIAQLRSLPASDTSVQEMAFTHKAAGPIHAVCLDITDAEADALHFSTLLDAAGDLKLTAEVGPISSVANANVDKLTRLFKNMHIVSLIKTVNPDGNFGLAQPGDGEGILSGAIPTAETVIHGVEQITPQLMALGYATGKEILPDHAGVYPPLDRMSVLTYWWGLEVMLPPPSLEYLSKADSISHAVINFLTAMSVLNDGIREILPFIRYIGQFVDFEWSAIQQQNQGQGVVCAATWIMPAAMVPRPWDFAAPPTKPTATVEAPEVPPVNAAHNLADPTALVESPRPSTSAVRPSNDTHTTASESGGYTSTALPHALPELVISSPGGTDSLMTI